MPTDEEMMPDPVAREQTRLVEQLTDIIAELLAGRPRPVQSSTIADVLSMHLSGIQAVDPKDEAEAIAAREAELSGIVTLARTLLPMNVAATRRRYEEKLMAERGPLNS